MMEVIMVMLFLAAVLIPLLQVFSSGLLVSSEVKDSNTAIILAQKKMEELRNTTYDLITDEAKTAVPSFPAYSSQVIVNTPNANLKDVKVVVRWFGGEGSETGVSLETLISNF